MNIYAASYLLPINGSPIEGGAVAVENGIIKAVGRLADLRKNFTASVYEFPGSVIMPGLVNAHTHLELTHFPAWLGKSGFANSFSTYVDWIINVIKVKRMIDADALSASLMEGFSLSIQNGTTMVGDILSDRRLINLYKYTQLSGRVYLEFLGQDNSKYAPLLDSIDNDLDLIPNQFLSGISPHSPFTVSKSLLKSLLDIVRTRKIPVAMHLSESLEEILFFRDSSGRIAEELYPFVGWSDYLPVPMGITPVQWLDCSDALAADFLAVHGVHLTIEDIKLISKRGSSVVLVPRSNNNLDVGKAPVREMLKAGIPLSLGTDSLASSQTLSLWDEMRYLIDAFPQQFSPDDALRMATIGGAKAIKRDNETGTLEPGKRADFIVMETGKRVSVHKIYEQLLEDSFVRGVWCGGESVYKYCS